MDQALLLFAKVPRPGAVKTRLTPVLTFSEAAQLYSAFLRDALRQGEQLEADVYLYLSPPLPEDGLDWVPSAVSVREQQGDSLGARMKRAFQDTLNARYERVLLMGTDHPTLPSSFVAQGFQALQTPHSVCLGPTKDGGFYLIGMNRFYPRLFENMSYSHPRVFSQTLARASRTDAHLTVLPRWYDVDGPPDLDRMRSDLEARSAEAPNTRRVLSELGLPARP